MLLAVAGHESRNRPALRMARAHGAGCSERPAGGHGHTHRGSRRGPRYEALDERSRQAFRRLIFEDLLLPRDAERARAALAECQAALR